MPGLPVFGAGWIGVQARHGDRMGEYPIFMPMTTEQSTIGGRETNGEPKKLAEVEVHRDGDRVEARIARMGFDHLRDRGHGDRDPRQLRDGQDRLLVQAVAVAARRRASSTRTRCSSTARRPRRPGCTRAIEGELILKEAPLDPIADLVVRRMVDLNWTERASTQVGRVIGPVPRADLAPFMHQRYDDLSVLGAKR